ncbi:SUKH-4 family immunity protein [Embleya sp. NPDC059237]|uniref:SUKH-4 family immunity protein n=1 Tax=Embleya sp. NPDC059237 TaxID=3346784 RepID=UPI003696DE5A
MIFDIDRGRLLEAFPERRVVRASRAALAEVEGRAEDLDFLCDVGLPQGLFQIAPALAGEEGAQLSRLLDLGDPDEGVDLPELDGVGPVLLLGGIQYWYVFLHLETGRIHAFPEDGSDYCTINGDLSSLCTMLCLLEQETPRTAPGTRGPSNDEYAHVADSIRARVEPHDPLPYQGDSLWVFYFGSYTDGLYPLS